MEQKDEDMEFIESEFKPELDWCDHTIMTGNIDNARLTVYGHTRLIMKDLLIPNEIMNIVLMFYAEELVHFLKRDIDKETFKTKGIYHWVVNITEIIPNYYH